MANLNSQNKLEFFGGLFVFFLFFIGTLINSQQVAASDLSSGLVGFWKLNDAGGYTAKDSSGEGNDGYLGRYMLWGILGQVDTCLMFNGNNYISTGDLEALDFGPKDSFTLSAWVKLDDSIRDYRAILGKANNSSLNGYVLRYDTNGSFGIMIEASDGQKEVNVIAEQDYRDNEWHHVVGVINRLDNTSTIYVDGQEKNKRDIKEVGSLKNGFHFNIGALENGLGFKGFIDEARVYNRALSSKEVKQLYSYECNCVFVDYPVEKKYSAGSLLRAESSYKVYHINNRSQKRWLINEKVFSLYNNKWADVIEVEQDDLDAYEDVELLRAINSYKVYKISGVKKQWIETIEDFESGGYKWEDVNEVLEQELVQYTEE